jgi:hypothetical protein
LWWKSGTAQTTAESGNHSNSLLLVDFTITITITVKAASFKTLKRS